MNKLLSLTLTVLLSVTAFSQSIDGSTGATPLSEDAGSKIIIIPYIGDVSGVPEPAYSLMLDKMKQILLRNGLVDYTDRSRYVMTVHSNVLSKEWTETVPAKYAMTVEFDFYIGDAAAGLLYSNYNVTRKAVGDDERAAYMQAVKAIKTSDPGFTAMLDECKQKILNHLATRDEEIDINSIDYNINWW